MGFALIPMCTSVLINRQGYLALYPAENPGGAWRRSEGSYGKLIYKIQCWEREVLTVVSMDWELKPIKLISQRGKEQSVASKVEKNKVILSMLGTKGIKLYWSVNRWAWSNYQ